MSKWGWFSCDKDSGEVVAKTDVQNDGTVNRYTYTKPDNIKEGHGDTWYNNINDFYNDNPIDSRPKDAPESINRPWKGNGHTFNPQEFIEEETIEEATEFTKILKLY